MKRLHPHCQGSRCEGVSPSARKAFTLVEALIASVILVMAVTAITLPFTAGMQHQSDDSRRTLAVNLAQELMEEILAKPFYDPGGNNTVGPEYGETRFTFDNIDDYDGYTETAGHIIGADGQTVTDPAAAGLSRTVTAKYVYVAGQNQSEQPTFIRVCVEVDYKGQTLATLSRLVFANH